jgi:biotin carboxylase
MSKKIMVISSSLDPRLVGAVEAARALGMETVACTREVDDGTLAHADRFYSVDGHKTEELLEIAKKEKIDAVLGTWDKSVLSAAIIAKELGLPGNSPDCVRTLMEKGRFRALQRKAGVFCPEYFETDTSEGLEDRCAKLRFPIIVKPAVCSSSFGMTKLYDRKNIIPAFEKAAAYSRNGVVCVEEFIEQDSLRVLEADIFLVGDDILWDGTSWCYRLPEEPLRPAIDVFPASLDSREEAEFHSAVRCVLAASGARLGEFNVEGFFTDEGRFFVIEINPRPAGYYFQKELKLFCGVDFSKLLVTTAVGDLSYYEELKSIQRQRRCLLTYAVFSFVPGIFDHVYIDDSIRDYLISFDALPGGEPGAYIESIHADNRPVGIAMFAFSSEEELYRVLRHIRDLVYVVLRDT